MQINKAALLQGLHNIRKIGKAEELVYLTKKNNALWLHTISSCANVIARVPILNGSDEDDFALGLSGMLMTQVISKMPDDIIHLIYHNSVVVIAGSNHRISLNRIADAQATPNVVQALQAVHVNTEPLKKYVNQTEHFLGDPARDIRLGSFHVEILQDKSIRITALDSNNISIRGCMNAQSTEQYVLHGRSLKDALEMLDKVQRIGVSDEQYFILQGTDTNQVWYQVSIFSINRPFFKLDTIMMQESLSAMKVMVNRQQLLNAVDLASLFDKVDLHFHEEFVEITGSVASGSVNNIVPVEHTGSIKEMSIQFRAANVMKAIKAMTGDTICIIGGAPNLPLFFSSQETETEIMLPIIHV